MDRWRTVFHTTRGSRWCKRRSRVRAGATTGSGWRRHGVGEFRVLISLRVRTNRRHQGMRQVMGRTTGPKRGGGVPAVHRIRRFTVTGAADSGKPFRWPGGDLSLDTRGKMERKQWAFYSCGKASNRASNKENWRGSNRRGETQSLRDFSEWEEEEDADT
jgi:hypothetical protein